MAENKKSGKGLIIFLIILVIALATVGTLLFTGVIKSPMVKCEEKTTEKTDTKTDSDTKKSSTTEKTVEERYKDYINNLANEIKEKSKFEDGTVESTLNGIINDTYNNVSLTDSSDSKWNYTVSITKDLDLLVTGNGYTDYKIGSNVVSYYRIFYGQSGFSNIYFITTDGVLHSFNLEPFIYGGKEPSVKALDKKNIVEVRQGSTTAKYPIFVDIDGNLYTD